MEIEGAMHAYISCVLYTLKFVKSEFYQIHSIVLATFKDYLTTQTLSFF